MKHTGKLSVSESNNLVILNDKHQMIAGADTRQRNCHEIAAELVRRWNAHAEIAEAFGDKLDHIDQFIQNGLGKLGIFFTVDELRALKSALKEPQ